VHFLKEHHSGIFKRKTSLPKKVSGIGDQNDDDDIDELQDILEDVHNDSDKEDLFQNIGEEH